MSSRTPICPMHGLPDLEDHAGRGRAAWQRRSCPASGARAHRDGLFTSSGSGSEGVPPRAPRDALPGLVEDTARPLDSLRVSCASGIDQQVDPGGAHPRLARPRTIRRVRREQERVRGSDSRAPRKRPSARSAGAGSDPVVTVRNDRHLIQVTRERLGGPCKGVVHAQSGSGASVYIEPSAVVPHNNELAELRSAEDEEVRRILTRADRAGARRARATAARTNEEALAEIDTHYAAGKSVARPRGHPRGGPERARSAS